MTQSTIEWQRATAEKVLRAQVDAISRSQFPSSDSALSFAEAYYTVDLLDDVRLGYWRQAIENVVQFRRQELRAKKHAALFPMPTIHGDQLMTKEF